MTCLCAYLLMVFHIRVISSHFLSSSKSTRPLEFFNSVGALATFQKCNSKFLVKLQQTNISSRHMRTFVFFCTYEMVRNKILSVQERKRMRLVLATVCEQDWFIENVPPFKGSRVLFLEATKHAITTLQKSWLTFKISLF